MKAAVIFQKGEAPKYVEDFAAPEVQKENETLISVKASAVKNLDKMRASGKHYSTEHEEWTAKVPGGDGMGVLEDGTRVYAIGVSGMLAEKATVEKDILVKLPAGIDDATAAALPNAVMGSALALRFRAGLQKGETVLINGATGVTGKMSVQIAKHYGAKKVIATGRNEQSLKELLTLGADEVISLKEEDENIVAKIKGMHSASPIDIVIDYLWGHSAELIFASLKGDGRFSHRTRFITVGGMAGDTITLSSSVLRSTDIQLSGSGLGTWSKQEVKELITEILPEMFQLAVSGKLKMDTVSVPLKEIEKLWNAEVPAGKRLVVII
ncbi:MAG: zinc-binding alcohol dehydrogenase family protein [Terrimonas sp.]|nr:zinc-binding alcohol dehydrogenase family protein [Terrimonas sp.]OJY79186.1 MAG: alcohol dehydrogenase [Sphingobacteriales bacterium 40-81]